MFWFFKDLLAIDHTVKDGKPKLLRELSNNTSLRSCFMFHSSASQIKLVAGNLLMPYIHTF